MHFRGIMSKWGKHQTTIRKTLDILKAQGLVKERAVGNKLLYSLTKKGKSKLMNEALERVNEGLKIVKEFSAMLLDEKLKLEEWRGACNEAIMNVKITEDMPIEERIRRVLEEEKRTFGPLEEAYKNMHALICEGHTAYQKLKQFSPELDPSQFFIGFPDGYLYLVHVSFLKEKGLYEKFKGLMP